MLDAYSQLINNKWTIIEEETLDQDHKKIILEEEVDLLTQEVQIIWAIMEIWALTGMVQWIIFIMLKKQCKNISN